jgi:hypothetical protein
MRTILEASDWLLGAKGHLPGRGGGPMAFQGVLPPIIELFVDFAGQALCDAGMSLGA